MVLTRVPGGTPGAMEIRNLLVNGEDDRWLPKTELLLLAAARLEHWEKLIKPALEQGQWVICDRFSDSTVAYQGYGRGMDLDHIELVGKYLVPKSKPDLTILLDMDVEVGLQRAISRDNSASRFEKLGLEFHQRVHNGFLKQARNHPKRIKVIKVDDLTSEQVATEVVKLVEKL